MCFVTARKPRKTEGFGWKVYIEEGNRLFSTNCAPSEEQGRVRVVNKWLRAKVNTEDFRDLSKKYKTGWTIFEKKSDAIKIRDSSFDRSIKYVLRKVQYKNADLLGTVRWAMGYSTPDLTTKTRQARYIKILP